MEKICPLFNIGRPAMKIPDQCRETCDALFDAAVAEHRTSGDYDYYAPFSLDTDCNHEKCDVDYSHASVKSLGMFTREYTIVDAYSCGSELGEQGYAFTCPLPIDK